MTHSTPTTTHTSPGRCRPKAMVSLHMHGEPAGISAPLLGQVPLFLQASSVTCLMSSALPARTGPPGSAPSLLRCLSFRAPIRNMASKKVGERERQADHEARKAESQQENQYEHKPSPSHEIKRRLPSERGAAGGSVQNTNPLRACFISSCSLFNHRKSVERQSGTLDPQFD